MPILKLPDGGAVETFDTPPRGFDLASATESDLERYGLKGLTEDRNLRSRLVSQLRGMQFIAPTFSPREPTPRMQENLPAATEGNPAIPLAQWSGAIVRGSPADPICWVQGALTVPSFQPPPGAPPGYYGAGAWLGMDGMNDGTNPSSDIVQAGCEASLSPAGLIYKLWCQWHPQEPPHYINLPVGAGDSIGITIRVDPGSRTQAAMLVANNSKGVQTNFGLLGLSGYPLVGNCAEWVVERQPQLGLLGDFGIVSFTNCAVGAVSGASTHLETAAVAYMYVAGHVLAACALTGPNACAVRFNPNP
jgi:hypothetical protein